MTARQKLNRLHVIGSLGVAAIVGVLSGSWAIFATVAAVFIATDLYCGKIRPDKGNRQTPGRE